MGTIKTTNIEPIADNGTVTLGSSGDTFTIPSGVTMVNNGTQTGFGGDNTPAFAVRKSGDQGSVGSSSNVKVTFETEILDTDNAFASSKFTIPSGEAGKYVFYGNIRNNTGTDFSTFQINLFKNGSAFGDYYAMYDNQNDSNQSSSFSAIVDCSVGDYFEIYCYQNSGGNLTLRQNGCHFYGYKIII